MVGFINAVGVNIVLGQLANLTGYAAEGGNRVVRAVNTVIHPGRLDGRSLLVGVATVVLIVLLERTRLGALGMVVAVVATSAVAQLGRLDDGGDAPRPGRRGRLAADAGRCPCSGWSRC